MLYLVNCEVMGSYAIPDEEWLGLVIKGIEEVVRYREEGKVVFHGGVVGRQAGCMIWDVESNEELQRLLSQLPFWPLMEWEITPLISTEQALESLKQARELVRASGE